MFVFVRHSPELFDAVRALQLGGTSDMQIHRLTGIARGTLRRWRTSESAGGRCAYPVDPDWRPPDAGPYSYLLGLYLGDGCLIRQSQNSVRLALCLDGIYPAILEEASKAMQCVAPGVEVHRNTCRNSRAILVFSTSPVWFAAFPQHGPGRKHERPIYLADWQAVITREHPRELIRGLIHSDGARCMNKFDTKLPSGRTAHYEYVRYFFSNMSSDIRRIFCEHCELLGIRWTQSNRRNISVSHRDSVAVLDEFVGPKR
jgi:hypothetical protein